MAPRSRYRRFVRAVRAVALRSVCDPSTSVCAPNRRFAVGCSVPNTSAQRRSSRSLPHTERSRRGRRHRSTCVPAIRSGSSCAATASCCSTPTPVVRCAARSMREPSVADVALRSVAKRFGDITAVDDLSIHVENGELLVLLGPTGAGKTTTLRLVAGLERPDAGSVSIGGRDVTLEPPAVRDVAFVFQQYSLYPHQTVYDNLAFPLRSPARRMNEAEIRSRVHAIAELLHIEAKLGNRATRLSGGEMQRVAIGRALVRAPSIFLMDEPLSSLDAKLRSELRPELKRI